ncbi:MAG: immunoglobulin domain-containing protein [Verrucomicrobiae bacterium]|nr:immunoglobulin domain-containing protein [Verrucomicrobiae bacterium]
MQVRCFKPEFAYLWWLIVTLGCLGFHMPGIRGATFFSDSFNYLPGNLGAVGASGGWQNSNVGVTVTSNSLDGAILGLPQSTGNKVTITTGSTSGTYNQFSSGVTTGAVYYSFLLRVNATNGLDSNGKLITGLIRAGSQSSYYVDAVLRLAGGQVQLGICKLRAVTNWFATPLEPGMTYFVVLKYEFVTGSNNDKVALWVNPGLGSAEPAPNVSFSTGSDGNDSTGVGRCFIYGGTAVDLDEIRIASTWAEAAPKGAQAQLVNPVITSVFVTPDGIVIAGTNGQANAPFELISSTDLALPLAQWPEIASENFRADGSFCVTNPLGQADQQRFFALRLSAQSRPSPPVIVQQPQSRTNYAGTTASFSVVATGSLPLFYQWFFNLTNALAGQTSPTLTLTNVQSADAGDYTVVVTNAAGAVTSQVAKLTVIVLQMPPSIVSQPQSQTVREGGTATFTVGAEGTGPLSYQWYRASGAPLANRTNAVLVLENVSTNDAGGYFAVVINPYGSATSAVATLVVTASGAGTPDFGHVGFADVGFALTGGEGGQVVTATTGAELKAYADSNAKYVIYVSGTLYSSGMEIHVRSHKTIIGLGTNATLVGGGLYMYNSSNIIVRNLTIRNSSEDGIGITSGANHIWIDHCTIADCRDGLIDIVKGADYVTVSWCRFYYTDPANTHRFACLVGASDGDASRDMGRLRVTFHHNWWGNMCIERMPSVRFGRAHIFNNYFNAPGNNYCVRSRLYAECRIENNWFESVRNPWEVYLTSGTPGKVFATGNRFVNVTWYENTADGRIVPPGTDEVFAPPYSYTLDPVDSVPGIVSEHAGAGRGPFAP